MAERNRKQWGIDLLLLCVLALGILCGFMWMNALAPLGERSLAIHDADIQYLDFFQYYKQLAAGGFRRFYSLGMTLGDSTIAVFSYYLSSPLNLLLLGFAEKDLASAFNILVMAKFLLAALSCYTYLFYRFPALKRHHAILLSCSYMLMQYNVSQAGNVMWLDGVYMLPLILLGTYRLVANGKFNVLLTATVALSFLFNWYSGAINCLFSGFYLLFECYVCRQWKRGYGILWRYGVAVITGVLLSSFLFFPTILSLRSGRGTLDWNLLRHGFLGNVLESIPRSCWGGQSERSGVSLYAGSFVLIGCIGYFCGRNISGKEKRAAAFMLFLHILFYYYRPLFVLFSLFKSASSYWFRYSYGSIFFLIWLAASFYRQEEKKKLWTPLAVWLLLSAAVSYFVSANLFFVGIWAVLIFLNYGLYRAPAFAFLRNVLLTAVLCTELLGNTRILISEGKRYSSASAFSQYTVTQRELIRALKAQDPTLYRVSLLKKRLYTGKSLTAQYNQPLAYDIPSFSGYTSDPDNRQRHFLARVGYPESGENMNITNEVLLAIDSLLGSKYILANEALEDPSLLPVFASEYVYRNPYALPLAFKVSSSASEEIRYEGNPFLYQNCLFEKLTGHEEKLFSALDFTFRQNGKKATYYFPEAPENTVYYGNIIGEREMDAVISVGKRSFSYSRWLAPAAFSIGRETEILWESKKDIAIRQAQFYALDLQRLAEVTDYLQASAATDIHYENGNLDFTLEAKDGEYALVTLPLNDGWELSRNGQEVSFAVFADTFYLLPLQNGKNHIHMHYTLPGAKTGLYLSLAAGGILAALLWKQRSRKR